MDLLWFLLIGLVAGFLADMLVKGVSFGLLGEMVVGVIGAYVGGFLFSLMGIDAYGTFGAIIMATAGAVVFLLVLKMFDRRSHA